MFQQDDAELQTPALEPHGSIMEETTGQLKAFQSVNLNSTPKLLKLTTLMLKVFTTEEQMLRSGNHGHHAPCPNSPASPSH